MTEIDSHFVTWDSATCIRTHIALLSNISLAGSSDAVVKQRRLVFQYGSVEILDF
jgi:hypothetical protein